MAPHNQSTFQPVPPIRTNTVDSQKSQSSGQMSPPFSPLTPTSPAPRAGASPTEASFFGAITSRIRGRSRSRSRGPSSRKRSKSPMIMPPEQAPQRHSTIASPTRPAAAPAQSRPSIQDAGRRSTSGSDPWRGRHSNDWLFNGISITGTAKEFIQRRKS